MLRYDLIYHLPGYLSAWDGVEQALGGGQAVIIRVESKMQRRLVSDFVQSASMTQGYLDVLSVADLADFDPFEALNQLYAVNGAKKNENLAQLFSAAQLPNRVLLTGFEDLPTTAIPKWSTVLNEWAHQAFNNKRTPELLVISSPCPEFETRVSRLGAWITSDWSNLPTDLEVQLIVKLSLTEERDLAKRLWRQYLLPALCGRDWELIDYLWEPILGGRRKLLDALRVYAARSGQVIDPRSAAAAVTNPDRVDKMLWLGQMQAVYPILNRVRFRMTKEITEHLGADDWPSLVKRESDPDTPAFTKAAAADFRQINDILLRQPLLKQLANQFLEVAELSRDVRNDLAHYQPISFQTFEHWLAKVQESGIY